MELSSLEACNQSKIISKEWLSNTYNSLGEELGKFGDLKYWEQVGTSDLKVDQLVA